MTSSENIQDETYPDTALEIIESREDQSFSNKYFNGSRGEIKLTRLNVEKKPKVNLMSVKKPLNKLYTKIFIVSLLAIVIVLTMIFFYLASPLDGSEDDPEVLIPSTSQLGVNSTNNNMTISDSGHK